MPTPPKGWLPSTTVAGSGYWRIGTGDPSGNWFMYTDPETGEEYGPFTFDDVKKFAAELGEPIGDRTDWKNVVYSASTGELPPGGTIGGTDITIGLPGGGGPGVVGGQNDFTTQSGYYQPTTYGTDLFAPGGSWDIGGFDVTFGGPMTPRDYPTIFGGGTSFPTVNPEDAKKGSGPATINIPLIGEVSIIDLIKTTGAVYTYLKQQGANEKIAKLMQEKFESDEEAREYYGPLAKGLISGMVESQANAESPTARVNRAFDNPYYDREPLPEPGRPPAPPTPITPPDDEISFDEGGTTRDPNLFDDTEGIEIPRDRRYIVDKGWEDSNRDDLTWVRKNEVPSRPGGRDSTLRRKGEITGGQPGGDGGRRTFTGGGPGPTPITPPSASMGSPTASRAFDMIGRGQPPGTEAAMQRLDPLAALPEWVRRMLMQQGTVR